MSEIKLTTGNFEAEVINSSVPVLIDFWATWCGPCRMIAPFVERIAEEYEGSLKVGKVNVDEEPALANAFGIDSIPTLILIKDGKATAKSIGYKNYTQLEKFLKENNVI